MNKTTEPMKFLCNGTRYKVQKLVGDVMICGLPDELIGEWVALIDATDGKHLRAEPELNLNCPSVQERLAAVWGYVKAEPVHQSWCNTVVSLSPNPVKCNCKAEPVQEPVGAAGELFTMSALERLDVRPSTPVYLAPVQPVKQEPKTIGNALRQSGLDAYDRPGDLAFMVAVTKFATLVQPVKQETEVHVDPVAYVLWGDDNVPTLEWEKPTEGVFDGLFYAVDAKAIRAEALEEVVKACESFGKEWFCEATTNEIIAAIRMMK